MLEGLPRTRVTRSRAGNRMERILGIRSMRSTEVGENCQNDCVDGPHGPNYENSIHPGGANRVKEVCGWIEWIESYSRFDPFDPRERAESAKMTVSMGRMDRITGIRSSQ